MNIATQSKQLVFGCLVATLLARTVCVGAVIFSQGHVHPEVHRNVNELEVAVHDHDNDEEYEADEVLFFVTDAHKTTVPSNPLFSFLGSPGSPVWITPQTQQSGKLFMGLGASELNASDWLSPITIELVGFSGPGNFFLYQTDSFGNPTLHMRTDDGVSPSDAVSIPAGSHDHWNFAFTQPGQYLITLQASGTNSSSVFMQSELATFDFQVSNLVPEPSTALLLAVGGTLIWRLRRVARTARSTIGWSSPRESTR